jgi:GTPase SAR1 family protein
MKHLCIVGPKNSGKTVFIYLFLRKLLFNTDISNKFNNVIVRGLDTDVQNMIDNNEWPNATRKHDNLNIIKLYLYNTGFLKQLFKKNKMIHIPDVAGEIFEALTQEQGINDEQEDITLKTIREANAFILVVDSATLKRNVFYRRFLVNLTEKIKDMGYAQIKIPFLILLNKSDLIRKEGEPLYGCEKEAKKYIYENNSLFYSKILNLIDAPSYAFHSSTSGLGQKEYSEYLRSDPKEYLGSVMRFLEKI